MNTSESNFCEQIAEVMCHNLYECCTESEIEDFLDVTEPRTENQCREDVRRRCDRSSHTLRDSLAAGRVQLDTARLNDCLNAVLTPDGVCSEVVPELPWDEPCSETPWLGTVQPGGSCFFDHDCAGAPDAFCGPDQKCKTRPTAGFPCGTGCASDFYCSGNGTCAARGAVGAPCTTAAACQEDLFCDIYATPEPVCATKLEAGAMCRLEAACVSGDCVPGQCMGTTQSCFDSTDCASRCAISGATCLDASDCALGSCSVSGTLCDDALDCQASVEDTCVFPQACVPGSCVGDPVCTAKTLIADYCFGVGFVPEP